MIDDEKRLAFMTQNLRFQSKIFLSNSKTIVVVAQLNLPEDIVEDEVDPESKEPKDYGVFQCEIET